MEFFKHEVLSDRLIRIIDCVDNCCYLCIGDKEACLVDTGDGYGDLKNYCEKLTDKPIIVLLTHGHLDHTGGAACFKGSDIYLHEKDVDLASHNPDVETRYLRNKNNETLKNISKDDYNQVYKGPFKPIVDGQIFELGSFTIKACYVPGHTNGMILPIFVEERIAMCGDAIGEGTLIFANGPCISEYKTSLLKFKNEHEKEYDRIMRNHTTFTSPLDLVDNNIDCCNCILEGKASNQKIEQFGYTFYFAKEVNEKGQRVDGKKGNIKYELSKAK